MVRRTDSHAVCVDWRAGVKSGAKPNALWAQRGRTVVEIFGFVMQSDADRHRLSIVKRTLEPPKRRPTRKNHQNRLAKCSPGASKPRHPPRNDDTRRIAFCQSTTSKSRRAVKIALSPLKQLSSNGVMASNRSPTIGINREKQTPGYVRRAEFIMVNPGLQPAASLAASRTML